MNDRFKFRVWDTITNTYDYKFPYNRIGMFYLAQNGHLFSDFGNTVAPEIKQDRFIIEQCTGFPDKNGTLIYEGDLLQDNCGTIYEVGWDDGGYWSILDYQSQECEFLRYPSNCKIIGNIHNKGDVK